MISVFYLIYFSNWMIGVYMLLLKRALKLHFKNFCKCGLLWLCRSWMQHKTFSLLMCTAYTLLFLWCLTHFLLCYVGRYCIWLFYSWHLSSGISTLLLLKFYLPKWLEWHWNSACHCPLNIFIAEAPCDILCFSVGVGAPGQLCT
jgi:hypothetical protein